MTPAQLKYRATQNRYASLYRLRNRAKAKLAAGKPITTEEKAAMERVRHLRMIQEERRQYRLKYLNYYTWLPGHDLSL